VLAVLLAGVAEGRDPLAELAQDDPREQQAKQAIEQVGAMRSPCMGEQHACGVY
jgi:hypothetical protein